MASKRPRALSYLRVSGKDQARDGRHGFDRQRDAIQQYARSHRTEVVGEYRDVESGSTELSGREGLGELLVTLRSNGIDPDHR